MSSTQKLASRYKLSAETKILEESLQIGVATLVEIEGVASSASKTLNTIRRKLTPKGRVWQSNVLKLMKALDVLFEGIDKTRIDLKWSLVKPTKGKVLDSAIEALEVPKNSTTDYLISDIQFEINAEGKDEITYDLKRLEAWLTNLKSWAIQSQKVLGLTLRKL